MIKFKTPQPIQAIFFYALLSFLSSCSNDKTPITASTDPTINSAQLWLTNQIEQNDQMKSWNQAFSPLFEWNKAQLLVSPNQDSIIEIPYQTQQKYKYGVGPAGNKGEYGISKYIEAHATRMAISVHHNKYSARLMHLFADTMMLGDQKTFYPVDSLQKINFVNSFQSNPNYAVLIGYANFKAALKTLKYYELGMVRMQGKTMSKYIAEEQSQRPTCTELDVMVIETPQWNTKWGMGIDWDLPPLHEFMVSFGECEERYADCKPSKESIETHKYYQRLAKKTPKGCDFVPDCCTKLVAEVIFQELDELFPLQAHIGASLCIDATGGLKRVPELWILNASGDLAIEKQELELLSQKKIINPCAVEFVYRVKATMVRKSKAVIVDRKEVLKEVSFLFEEQ